MFIQYVMFTSGFISKVIITKWELELTIIILTTFQLGCQQYVYSFGHVPLPT